MIRPAEHLVYKTPVAFVDGRICAVLNRLLALDKFRAQVRGKDAELDHTLLAMKLAEIAHTQSSATGTTWAPKPEPVSRSKRQLNETVSTTTAAAILNMTPRAVCKAIAEKRLAATKLDGRYRITRYDLTAFMADRM